MSKIVYVGFKFNHMGVHAGYDLIKYYAHYDSFINCQFEYNIPEKLSSHTNLFSKFILRFFTSYMWLVELRCLLYAIFNRNVVFHFVYAENTYRYLGQFKWLGFKIVCTYHQPSDFFISNPHFLVGINKVDQIIVLGNSLQSFFKNIIPHNRVHFIPHGVDCEYFSPQFSESHKEKRLLMVGNWLRNFQFASEVFKNLIKIDSNISIHVVTLTKNFRFFNGIQGVSLYSNITDDQLLDHYRNASLLFLPLDDFIANNAMLEMCSVGSPVLIATNNKKSDFNFKEILFYENMELTTVLSSIIKIINSDNLDAIHRRNYVLNNFSWPVIGNLTYDVLSN